MSTYGSQPISERILNIIKERNDLGRPQGETLYFIAVYGQRLIVTFGKYSANGRDRPVILQFKFFPADRALSILRGKTGENFPKGTVQICNNKMKAFVSYCIHLEYQ